MSILNAVLRTVFDLLLAPFGGLPPWVGLTLMSLLVSIFMLLIFKATSNQVALADVKRKIHAGLFEIRLFNDDLRAILRAQLEILRHNGNYLRLSLIPMVWILPPLVLIVAQMQFHYAYRGLEPGDTTLVTARLAESAVGLERPEISLEAPEGVQVEAGPVWAPSRRELTWRIGVQSPGDFELHLRMGEESFGKTLNVAGERVSRRSPVRVGSGLWEQLIYPAEPPLPAGAPIEEILLAYPDRDIDYFGFGTHWMVWLVVLSVIFAFALRNRMGVTI